MTSKSAPSSFRQRRSRLLQSYNSSIESSTSSGYGSFDSQVSYRILVLGAPKTGKTSIVRQFLYDEFSDEHTETAGDMYCGKFEDISGNVITFDIEDVGGKYVYNFPSMGTVSLNSADAFLLLFSLDDPSTFEEIYKLKEMINEAKDPDVPIVVVANKSDLPLHSDFYYESLQPIVNFDWENGYVECSAKECKNINKIFKELLNQSKPRFGVSIPTDSNLKPRNSTAGQITSLPKLLSLQQQAVVNKEKECDQLKHRQSLPIIPQQKINICSADIPKVIDEEGAKITINSLKNNEDKIKTKNDRRSSFPAILRKNSCRIS